MTSLVIAEHDGKTLRPATLNTVAAAATLGEVHVLVIGQDCRSVADSAATITGVAKVLLAEAPGFAAQLAENLTPVIVNLARKYSHVLAPATAFGKNLLPRVAALLDVQQISDIVAIEAPDTFKRPVYAGNAIATVKSADPIKVVTVRTTAFAAAAVGNSAPVESLVTAGEGDMGLSRFVSSEPSKSERPELTAAKVIVSGGRGVGSKDSFAVI